MDRGDTALAAPGSSQDAGPLAGILVADFSRVLAGPLAGMLLGDLGATVIKVERPGAGDDSRHWPPFAHSLDGLSSYFASVNRNKRSVALDFGDEADLAAARTLAERADVLIENLRPGTMSGLRLGYDELRAANPRLIYCSVTGFGRRQGAAMPGYDLVAQAMGGLMSLTGDPDGQPTRVGPPVVDVLTGLHAAIGILAALHDRARTGVGQWVEVTLIRSLLSSMVNQSTAYLHTGVTPARIGNRHPSIAPYESFTTRDGQIVIAVGNDGQFRALARALGNPGLADDPRFRTNADRVRCREVLAAQIEAMLAAADSAHWSAQFAAHGVPHGPVNDLSQAFATATALGLQPVAQVPSTSASATVATLAHPVDYSRTSASYRRSPPRLDADGDEVRAWLAADNPPPLRP
jgi:crotonobetainyl-CoA:carnitine CoA-transferase CaiB-like acyl-CoA transferase